MKQFTIIGFVAAVIGLVYVPEARAEDIVVDEAAMAQYFTPEEIAAYKAVIGTIHRVSTDSSDEVNRLTDPATNRCGNSYVPFEDCPGMQALAWNNGAGCINPTEYDYARTHAIGPICNPLKPQLFLGWCRCGCLEKNTQVYTFDSVTGQARMVSVDTITTDNLVFAMTDTATVNAPEFAPRTLYATTVGAEEKPLVVVHLQNGSSLGLTEEHAVLLSTGEMVPARSLDAASHQLVSRWGEFVGIQNIERVTTPDPVYNVLTDADLNYLGHMIVANDMIVGDIMWQNTLAADLWKVVVRM